MRLAPVLDYFNGYFVFRCSPGNRGVDKAAVGLSLHRPYSSEHAFGVELLGECPVCAAGLKEVWYTTWTDHAVRLQEYASPAALAEILRRRPRIQRIKKED